MTGRMTALEEHNQHRRAIAKKRKTRTGNPLPVLAQLLATYRIVIEGEPVAKARPRVVNGHTYTPEKTRDAEEVIAWAFKAAYPGEQPDSESSFSVFAEFHISNYKNGNKRKFDLDNGIKTCLDALNGIVWADDNQITEIRAIKYPSETPKTIISIRRG